MQNMTKPAKGIVIRELQQESGYVSYDENRHPLECQNIPDNQWLCQCAASGKIVAVLDKWAVVFKCSKEPDHAIWMYCCLCPKVKQRMVSHSSYSRHRQRFHGRKKRKGDQQAPVTANLVLTPSSTTTTTLTGSPCAMMGFDSPDESPHPPRPVISPPDDDECELLERRKRSKINWVACNDPNDLGMSTMESQRYFYHNHCQDGRNGGLQFLVKRSSLQQEIEPEELSKMDYPEHHYEVHMQIAKIATSVNWNDRELLTDMIQGCYRMGCEDGYKCAEDYINDTFNKQLIESNHKLTIGYNFVKTQYKREFDPSFIARRAHLNSVPVPACGNDIRKHYLEGKYAILPNLPMPKIYDHIKGHAVLSIIDCIQHHLAHHTTGSLECIDESSTISEGPVKKCSNSKRAAEIWSNAKSKDHAVANFLTEWSDDFEPNSFSKTNRGSAWVKTITIGTLDEFGKQRMNTFVIALGKKKECHDEVHRFHADELKKLKSESMSAFYIGSEKKKLHLHFELFASLQDQPERRGENSLCLGTSTFFGRWGVSANHNAIYPALKACGKCREIMVAQFHCKTKYTRSVLPKCENCLQWDCLASNPKGYTYPPDDYPSVGSYGQYENNFDVIRLREVNGRQVLSPFRVSYQTLKTAIDVAYDCFVNNKWTQKNVELYLKVEGLNAEFIEHFLQNAINAYALKMEQNNNRNHTSNILQDFRSRPEAYNKPQPPALWERVDVKLAHTIDAIMHLIFLGIVKSAIFQVHDWLTLQNKYSAFMKWAESYMSVFHHFKIDWLVIQPYKGANLGGWVSENYLGFARIMLWFYQNMEGAEVDLSDVPPDDKPQDKWTVLQNRFWLRQRGLDTKGKAAELRERVATYMKKSDCPAPMEIPERDVNHVWDMLQALNDLLRCVMQREVTKDLVARTELAVRVFLSAMDDLDTNMRAAKSKPVVVSQYNFLCLLNVPGTMEEVGPLKNLWEGDWRGEKILRIVKPAINQGLRTNWEANALKNICREMAFNSMLDNKDKPSYNDNSLFHESALQNRSTKFHKYESQLDIQQRLRCSDRAKKTPVSAILVDNGTSCRLFALAGDYDILVEIQLKTNIAPRRKVGLEYYSCDAEEDTLSWKYDVVKGAAKLRIGYVILLPLLDNNIQCFFACVSSNWASLSETTKLNELIDENFEEKSGPMFQTFAI